MSERASTTKVGTRIELLEITIDGSPSANGQLHLALTLANTGYGRDTRLRLVTLAPQPAYALSLNSLHENDNPIFDPTAGYNLIATFNVE